MNSANSLQVIPLPGGGAFLQNADGDIVGEVAVRADGTLSISGNTVNTNGSAGTINNSINASGEVQSNVQYTNTQLMGAVGIANTLLNIENFDDLSTLWQINTRMTGQRNYSENNSTLRSIYAGYVPISLARFPEKAVFEKAANDDVWRQQA